MTAKSIKANMLVKAADALIALRLADGTVSGATFVMPDGAVRFMTISDALEILGFGPSAGNA